MRRCEAALTFARACLLCLALLVFCGGAGGAAGIADFQVAPGFGIRPVGTESLRPSATAWDDLRRLWVLEPRPGRRGGPTRSALKRVGSFGADGAAVDVREVAADLPDAAAVVAARDDAWLGVAGGILRVAADGRRTTHALLAGEFPTGSVVRGMRWGPDLRIYFCFAAAGAGVNADAENAGVGRFDPDSGTFELYSLGLDGRAIAFDADGFPLVRHMPGGQVISVAPGGRYLTGGAAAEGVATQVPPVYASHPPEPAAGGFAVYDGDQFPAENRGTLLVAVPGGGAIRQLRLVRRGGSLAAEAWRDLVTPARGAAFDPVSVETGPDGAVWILDRAGACPGTGGRLWRLTHVGGGAPPLPWPSPRDPVAADTPALVAMLKRPDAASRRAAVRALRSREIELADRYHRDTAIHDLMDEGETAHQRLTGMLALHALGLLDEDNVDEAAKDKDELVRAWAALVTGERGMPLGSAITRLHKLSRDESVRVRQAVAWAARRFVSGSIVRDTPPAVHLREVLTGPVMSGLWFGLNAANDAALNTAYWNALRPMTAFDPVHAIGFYEENGAADQMPMSGWLLGRIAAQACGLRPRKLEEAVAQMGKIPLPGAATVVAAGLDGLIEGSRDLQAPPGEAAQAVVRTWAASNEPRVAAKAKQLLGIWQQRQPAPVPGAGR